jgi:hypothetical protein
MVSGRSSTVTDFPHGTLHGTYRTCEASIWRRQTQIGSAIGGDWHRCGLVKQCHFYRSHFPGNGKFIQFIYTTYIYNYINGDD